MCIKYLSKTTKESKLNYLTLTSSLNLEINNPTNISGVSIFGSGIAICERLNEIIFNEIIGYHYNHFCKFKAVRVSFQAFEIPVAVIVYENKFKYTNMRKKLKNK